MERSSTRVHVHRLPLPPSAASPVTKSGRASVRAILMCCVRRAVSRVLGHSDFFGMDMVLDINSDIYPVKVQHGKFRAVGGNMRQR